MIHLTMFGRRYRFQVRLIVKVAVVLVIMAFILSVTVLVKDEEEGSRRRAADLVYDQRERALAPRNRSSLKTPSLFKAGVKGNFEPIPPVVPRTGPGEQGAPLSVNSRDPEVQRASQSYGINMIACQQIHMNRSIPDTRPADCQYWHYPEDLPRASVILAFHNEGVCVIMRTIHSILQRSPPQFLEEILLVDDYSDRPELAKPLEAEISQFGNKVRLIRNHKREGLIRTRSLGAEAAHGEVIIFLDAHCEVNKNWLVPLLARIRADNTIMTVPLIDGIDHDTFAYRPVYGPTSQLAGTFEWGLLYKETPISPKEKKRRQHESEPWHSPTHAGGLFAIDRQFFLDLGGYDPGLEIWGGENFELSFKIWMCGGSIEWVPCSRVGHVYRAFMPYGLGDAAKKGNIIDMNYKRVVEVWMDEYKKYFYTRKPEARRLNAGDVSGQIAWRKERGCKSFKWYMDNVAYQVLTEYPILPDNIGWGEIKNVGNSKCWDVGGGHPPGEVNIHPCHGYGGNQQLRLNKEGQMSNGEWCLDLDSSKRVQLQRCRLGTVNGPWRLKTSGVSGEELRGSMYNTKVGLCAEAQGGRLVMSKCAEDADKQMWTIQYRGDE